MLISHISALNHSSLLGFVKDNEMQYFQVWPGGADILDYWHTSVFL